ncbi:hypothetical protein GO730_02305 [Spirosoma sp. HMF3257]|uniref:Uncharacterized protein n=1 Tax=Spirosoma telluris TaxID=2183553 RepID=A0A327NGW3_9BACT|nr:hypothetical protein [Spirosoma telluris]RAI73539.1 hypothetical protein HMF3257_02245 [Spirosoma telluris]
MNTGLPEHLQRAWTLLHRAPIAMAETNGQGKIRQLNPKAVQLMMPMVAHLGLPGDNLLDTLAGFLPSARQAIAGFEGNSGLILEQEPYRLRFRIDSVLIERQFSLTIEKINDDSLLIFFEDVTDLLLKADALRYRL